MFPYCGCVIVAHEGKSFYPSDHRKVTAESSHLLRDIADNRNCHIFMGSEHAANADFRKILA
jgi:hypothetical protein